MMRCFVAGIGVWSPVLPSWAACRERLAGGSPVFDPAAARLPAATWLPPVERRRATLGTRVVLSVAQEALTQAGWDAAQLPTIFASSSGSADITDELCSMLAAGDTQISPTKFHNSVHNAAAGYYSIAVQCRAPSLTLGAFDMSATMGLLDAVVQMQEAQAPVLLIAFDVPYSGPLALVRPLEHPWGIALALAPAAGPTTVAQLDLAWTAGAAPTPCADPGLEAIRAGNPTARLLPLLAALEGQGPAEVMLAGAQRGALRVTVARFTADRSLIPGPSPAAAGAGR